jgi:predicted transcriptional regulator YheO
MSFLPLVEFLAEVAGPDSEVVLHDLRSEEHSIVAIHNGALSGREAGDPITDFAKSLLRRGRREGRNFITNYLGKAGGSGKFLKSSTFFIRDDGGEIIGLLGINTDLSDISHAHRVLGRMLSVDETASGEHEALGAGENGMSIRETVLAVMEQVIGSYGVDPARMTADEKKGVVEALNERGIFLLKGVVSDVASRLEVSEQTIYRYLK